MNPFRDLIRRVRAGEEAAAAELVQQYEPYLRRAVRVRMVDPRLKRLIDSMDICQSVLASFFVRAALGQYDLNSPEELLKLLVTMARNKLNNVVARERAERRDYRRNQKAGDFMPAADDTPSQLAAARELLEKFRENLTTEERQIADLRAKGCEWTEIAAQLGGTPEARRKKLARALDRIGQQLGLEPEAPRG
ncbi:MAG TPA: sigma-70 family RNA polymerase sigma factor [Gemmataceae bacterium]|nr:sigma-70 family RNA polymerase sigma factor [Gemmataceae bacterium]